MRLKEGVLTFKEVGGKMFDVGRPILRAMDIIYPIMTDSGEFCITSLLDGTHGPHSLHYVGLAMDVRTRHLKDADAAKVLAIRLREELGRNYDVVCEVDHIHIETSDLWLAANGDPRKSV